MLSFCLQTHPLATLSLPRNFQPQRSTHLPGIFYIFELLCIFVSAYLFLFTLSEKGHPVRSSVAAAWTEQTQSLCTSGPCMLEEEASMMKLMPTLDSSLWHLTYPSRLLLRTLSNHPTASLTLARPQSSYNIPVFII